MSNLPASGEKIKQELVIKVAILGVYPVIINTSGKSNQFLLDIQNNKL